MLGEALVAAVVSAVVSAVIGYFTQERTLHAQREDALRQAYGHWLTAASQSIEAELKLASEYRILYGTDEGMRDYATMNAAIAASSSAIARIAAASFAVRLIEEEATLAAAVQSITDRLTANRSEENLETAATDIHRLVEALRQRFRLRISSTTRSFLGLSD